jgi:tetratricopeptide (TPR) repeat protein
MKKVVVTALASACLALGFGVGYAAKATGPGVSLVKGKPAKEAGLASLQEALQLAGNGSLELIAVARVYYLSGDKAAGQELLDKVLSNSPEARDWHRMGRLFAEAGENAKAEEFFEKALAANPEDDASLVEVGAWYIRTGQREKGEALLAKAFAENPDEFWHYVQMGEAFLDIATK